MKEKREVLTLSHHRAKETEPAMLEERLIFPSKLSQLISKLSFLDIQQPLSAAQKRYGITKWAGNIILCHKFKWFLYVGKFQSEIFMKIVNITDVFF